MRCRTQSACIPSCLIVLGVVGIAAVVGGCASDSSSGRMSRANHHRTYRLSGGDALGAQLLRNDPNVRSSNSKSDIATAEVAEHANK